MPKLPPHFPNLTPPPPPDSEFVISGSPEGVVIASVGAERLDGDTDTLYKKKTGYNTNTGWVAVSGGGGGGGGDLSTTDIDTSAKMRAIVTDETGSGAMVFATSPTLVTPNIGVATATSVNGSTIPTSKTFVVTTDNLAALAATTSAQLRGMISDETGTGVAVFNDSPTLLTPTITGPITLGDGTGGDIDLDDAATGFWLGTEAAGTETISHVAGEGTGNVVRRTLLDSVTYFEFALSDETTDITTGTAKVTWRAPFAFTVTAVRASLSTASSSGTPTVDINDGGTTILSTKLTIDANEKTSTTAAAAAVISDSAIADDAEITFDIDVAGTGAKGLKVKIYYTK